LSDIFSFRSLFFLNKIFLKRCIKNRFLRRPMGPSCGRKVRSIDNVIKNFLSRLVWKFPFLNNVLVYKSEYFFMGARFFIIIRSFQIKRLNFIFSQVIRIPVIRIVHLFNLLIQNTISLPEFRQFFSQYLNMIFQFSYILIFLN